MQERFTPVPTSETENIKRELLGTLGTDAAYLYLGDLDMTCQVEASTDKGLFDESAIHELICELLLQNGSKDVTFLPFKPTSKNTKNVNGIKLNLGADGDYEPVLEMGTGQKQIAIRSSLDVPHITSAMQNRVHHGEFSVPSGVLLLTANSLGELEAKVDRPRANDFNRANMLRVLANSSHAQLPRFPNEQHEKEDWDFDFLSRESHGIVLRVDPRKPLQVFSEVRYEPEKNEIPQDTDDFELHPNYYDFNHYFIIELS